MYKILYFLDYGKTFGGAANTLLNQAVLMKKAGHSVVIFFSDYLGKDMSDEYMNIFSQCDMEKNYAAYQISSQPEDIDIICLDENYEKFRERVKELHPDILHSVQLNPMVELVSRELEIPHIMNIYQFIPEFFSINYVDIFPHYHICDSWFWAKQWNKYLDTDFECIRTVVNIDESKNEVITAGKKIKYICVGVVCADKNQLSVIKAFHKALSEGIDGELCIYGYDIGTYAEDCRDYIKNNDLANNIRIEGFCSDMASVYESSDVLICGSVRESYPNAVSEAMAHGLIIICTPVGGVPEVIKDRVNGYLTDDYTVKALSKKILEFDEDVKKGAMDVISKNAHETFEQNHSPKVVAEKLLKYYHHVVNDNKKRTAIGIEDIRSVFAEWRQIFYKNYDRFTDPQKVAKKIWYLSYIIKNIESARKRKVQFYVWGTGQYGIAVKELIDVFLPEVHVSGFIDSRKEGQFYEYKIYSPEEILKKKNIAVFVAAMNGQYDIVQQLKKKNLHINKDYFILSARSW